MRLYHDPHYKRDRDHRKIVADNRRDARIRADLEKAMSDLLKPLPPEEKDPRTPEQIFAAIRIAERRVSLGFRKAAPRIGKPKSPHSKALKQARKRAAWAAKNLKGWWRQSATATDSLARPLETVMSELMAAELKFGEIVLEIERCADERREKLLRERMGHLKSKRQGLRSELHSCGGSLLKLLAELEDQDAVAAETR